MEFEIELFSNCLPNVILKAGFTTMFDRFEQRSHRPERLDTGDYTPEEYAKWHREMWFIHRVLGELRALRGSLIKELRANEAERITVLDVGAGSGELLRAVKRSVPEKELMLVGAELSQDAAVSIKNGSETSEVQSVRADAMKLPFADDAFDYIFSSLFLHHLTDEQAVTLLNEMSRVASRKFFVIDLRRHPLAFYFFKIVSRVFLQQFTREDGALSILKSFRPGELLKLARKAGFDDVTVTRSAAYRLVLSGGKGS